MEVQTIKQSAISHSEKDQYHMISPLIESNEQNKLTYNVGPEAVLHRTQRSQMGGERMGLEETSQRRIRHMTWPLRTIC